MVEPREGRQVEPVLERYGRRYEPAPEVVSAGVVAGTQLGGGQGDQEGGGERGPRGGGASLHRPPTGDVHGHEGEGGGGQQLEQGQEGLPDWGLEGKAKDSIHQYGVGGIESGLVGKILQKGYTTLPSLDHQSLVQVVLCPLGIVNVGDVSQLVQVPGHHLWEQWHHKEQEQWYHEEQEQWYHEEQEQWYHDS